MTFRCGPGTCGRLLFRKNRSGKAFSDHVPWCYPFNYSQYLLSIEVGYPVESHPP